MVYTVLWTDCLPLFVSSIYAIGSAILFTTSFPSEMFTGIAIPGFVVGAILIAIGLGGVQSSIQPFIGTRNYTNNEPRR